jgi:hypothetical protein
MIVVFLQSNLDFMLWPNRLLSLGKMFIVSSSSAALSLLEYVRALLMSAVALFDLFLILDQGLVTRRIFCACAKLIES